MRKGRKTHMMTKERHSIKTFLILFLLYPFMDFLNKVIHGDCLELLPQIPSNSVDSICTDPPYGLAFQNKKWDTFKPKEFQQFSEDWGRQALRILKPGGYMLSFGGTRTYHRMNCGLEDAGFDIKDTLMWLYGNGYPKSNNTLKPACDPISLSKKPTSEKNIDKNISKWRTGRLNIKDCTISDKNTTPTNVLLNDKATTLLTKQTITIPRFFYITKPSRNERDVGLDDLEPKERGRWGKGGKWTDDTTPVKNDIATLKPINLMRYLTRLVTPPKGTVLDPFAGSGTTGCACVIEHFNYILFEKRRYFAKEVIPQRIKYWQKPSNQNNLSEHVLLSSLIRVPNLDKWKQE